MSICAMPSFIIAIEDYSIPAMVMGVIVLIASYSFVASKIVWRNKADNWRSTSGVLQLAFQLKIILAVVWLPTYVFTKEAHFFVLLPDLYAAIIAHDSIIYLLGISRGEAVNFMPTLLVTVLQGAILGVFVIATAVIVILPISHLFKYMRSWA